MDAKNAEADAKRLRRAVFDNPNIYRLAERPLLLTLIASLHSWRGGSLPDNRQELYEDTVDLLLDLWESQKTFKDEDGVVRQGQPSLAEFLKLKDRRRMRRFLNCLAFEAHKNQDDSSGSQDIADIPEDKLVSGLLAISRTRT